jgi:hypothetical protein
VEPLWVSTLPGDDRSRKKKRATQTDIVPVRGGSPGRAAAIIGQHRTVLVVPLARDARGVRERIGFS